jgi:hypothetical protein
VLAQDSDSIPGFTSEAPIHVLERRGFQ